MCIAHAVERAGIEAGEVEDVVMGARPAAGRPGMQHRPQRGARAPALPVTVSGKTMDRQCASGLMAIATAAKQIIVDGMDVVAAGGQENISAVQDRYFTWIGEEADPNVVAMHAARLHADAADRRDRRQALRRQPRGAGRIRAAVAAAHRRRPAGRPLRRRDRAGRHHHGWSRTRRPARSRGSRSRSTATRATARRPRWKASPA